MAEYDYITLINIVRPVIAVNLGNAKSVHFSDSQGVSINALARLYPIIKGLHNVHSATENCHNLKLWFRHHPD
jgi:hypothetical protein